MSWVQRIFGWPKKRVNLLKQKFWEYAHVISRVFDATRCRRLNKQCFMIHLAFGTKLIFTRPHAHVVG